MSLKTIWKERAVVEHAVQSAELNAAIASFKPKSFEEIRDHLQRELKERIPQATHVLNDPTSTFSKIVDSLAATDADLHKQVAVLAELYSTTKKS